MGGEAGTTSWCMGNLKRPRKHYTERCGAVWALRLGTALAPDLAIADLRVLSDLGRATVLVGNGVLLSRLPLPNRVLYPGGAVGSGSVRACCWLTARNMLHVAAWRAGGPHGSGSNRRGSPGCE